MLRSLQRLDFNAQIRVLIDLRNGGIQRPDENSPGKAEILPKGENPRFNVTNLPKDGWSDPIQAARFAPAALYEKFYCARGDMENRIKEQQMDLFADRISTHWLASNQLRLWFPAFAHVIMSTLQAEVLRGTEIYWATGGGHPG